MQKTKKQLLGIGGLAFVAAITTIAANLPVRAESVGGEVQIEVVVYNDSGEIKIQSPVDGSTVVDSNMTISSLYSKGEKIEYTIIKDGVETPLRTFLTDGVVNGIDSFKIDLKNYGGYGRYTIKSVLTAINGTTTEDYTSFTYRAIIIKPVIPESDPSNPGSKPGDNATNPMVELEADDNVERVCFDVYDKSGKKVLNYCVDAEDMDNSGSNGGGNGSLYDDDKTRIELPFVENGLTDGEYTIEATPYTKDSDGDFVIIEEDGLGLATIGIEYTAPVAPDVPNTGGDDNGGGILDIITPDTGALFRALNISKADMIITSLIGFAIVSGGALYIMRKKARK